MAKLSKEKQQAIILVGLGTIAVLAGLWFGLASQQLRSLTQKNTDLEEARRKVIDAERLIKRAPEIQVNLSNVVRRLNAAEEEMASGDSFIWSFKLMESFMATNNVKLVDSSRPIETGVGLLPAFPYGAITFTVRATAFYHDFGHFLKSFENRFPYLRIQNLVMDPSSATAAEDAEKLTVRFEVVALKRP